MHVASAPKDNVESAVHWNSWSIVRGHQQFRFVGDSIANIVEQTPVRKRWIRSFMEHDNFGLFVEPAQPAAQEAPPATPPTINTLLGLIRAALLMLIKIRQAGSHSARALSHSTHHATFQLTEGMEFFIGPGGLLQRTESDRQLIVSLRLTAVQPNGFLRSP
jgi:hypothetical protein